MKKNWVIGGLALLLVTAATGVMIRRNTGYEVVHPKRGDITEAVYGLGKVKSDRRFEVIVGVISTVTSLHVVEGDQVKQGAPLIDFDHQARFRAPFAGTVTLVNVRPGETALPQQPSLRLEDLTTRYIELSLEQQDALRVKRGQNARVSFESVRGKVLQGKVSALYSRGDEFIARVAVEGLDPSVLPGMTADVSVEIGQIQNALLIPLRAVENGMVTLHTGNHWQKKKVEIGHVDGTWAEVRGDSLKTEDEIRVRPAGG